ncbi:MAG: hypothetical protein ACP5J5_04515 [Dissulfurimicrobium sp.]|uniref:hypothetical protein n=1 Tax=Dissulfurimicrobium TaxID=1769732 RepID=UPI001EDAAB62|nr:hypothetical protein [Dissulfurimicrobium hydrothermale]UKL14379.1 hypothetical protein LGS26_03855 [Dissulfurimicrobium hydrothermale]
MSKRRCPYCREKIRKDALICRYCRKELTPLKKENDCRLKLFAVFTGLAAGTVLAFFWGYYQERLKWRDEGLTLTETEQ